MKSGNWWEFYFIRYFIGSIFGAFILLAVIFHPNSGMKNVMTDYLTVTDVKLNDISSSILIGLLFLGTAFCYVASAPVLVTHTLRYRLTHSWTLSGVLKRWTVIIGIFLALCYALWCAISPDILKFILLIPATFFVYIQSLMLISCIKPSNRDIFKFYKHLAKDRANSAEYRKEYTESYRHLREHGNAFLILVCESALGMALFSCNSLDQLVIVLFIWLMPVTPIWFIATYLESRLKNV
ncbi:hypothetical protein ACS83_00140 [Vibrio alginolyticus]|uniref:hypothetical protein n=1 Tax=Vibrio alginolyticus TaxID=663 RepID=UPI0006A5B8CC|nr:hypothetical protein [Vibrio alginolyticus]KOE08493.1 hypothetical protein ACS83_00140 [Vibrio alginolyticus]MCR9543995.1 hypothetical protein [Vibrio alginolyticus]